jgi:Ni2+-binding GTPase involved in maturation of urease and hydrogenase
MKQAARYYMIGGFLGAGKTTAVAALAQYLTRRGQRVGLITNDQGSELVDTAMLRARGFATEEIPGGCFCCRFNSLVDAANKLTEATKPEAFVAEPVGSCTDLIATVSYPLRRIYGERFAMAPLSVLVDPVRAEQVFGLREGRKFSEKVIYIWRKQVEEADVIVIAKVDLIERERLRILRERLEKEFPGKRILEVSARTGAGVEEWFGLLETGVAGSARAMEVDYDVYADGEALLGWLNATVEIESKEEFDASALLLGLAGEMKTLLAGAEIAHLKMTFSPEASLAGEIAALSVVRSDIVPELTLKLDGPVSAGQLIVNCRAEGAPETLRRSLEAGVLAVQRAFPGMSARIEHVEQFRPGRPTPTHRLQTPEPVAA